MNLLILSLAWIAYFTLHSLLASIWFKDMVKRSFPFFAPYYRIVYNLISFLLIIPILYFIYSIESAPLIEWKGLWGAFSIAVFISSIGGLFWSARYYDMAEFLGISQLGGKGGLSDGGAPFAISPVHRYVRHPWYFLALLVIWTRDMNAPFLVSAVALTIYFIIGSRMEEKKLLLIYGKRYARYMKKVPGLLPLPWRYLRKAEVEEILGMQEVASARG